MLRVFLTIVLPLVAPTAIYLLWMWIAHWAAAEPPPRGASWARMPFVWLAVAGAVLLAVVLFVVTVSSGTSEPGTYVPPRWENGHIVPGHFEPQRQP